MPSCSLVGRVVDVSCFFSSLVLDICLLIGVIGLEYVQNVKRSTGVAAAAKAFGFVREQVVFERSKVALSVVAVLSVETRAEEFGV